MTIIRSNQYVSFLLILRESVDQTAEKLIVSSQDPREKLAPSVTSSLLLTLWHKISCPEVILFSAFFCEPWHAGTVLGGCMSSCYSVPRNSLLLTGANYAVDICPEGIESS